MLAGEEISQFETVTTGGEVTAGAFTITGENTGNEIDLHKSNVVLIRAFSPAATVLVGRCGEDRR